MSFEQTFFFNGNIAEPYKHVKPTGRYRILNPKYDMEIEFEFLVEKEVTEENPDYNWFLDGILKRGRPIEITHVIEKKYTKFIHESYIRFAYKPILVNC